MAWGLASIAMLGGLGTLHLAGWRLQVVESGSMAPTITTHSLIAVSPVVPRLVAEGDVITFRDPLDRRHIVVHRVVKVVEQPGVLAFQTQGDANGTPDSVLVPAADVRGRMRLHSRGLGHVARALTGRGGALLLIGLPLLLGLVSEARTWRARRRQPAPAPDVPMKAPVSAAMSAPVSAPVSALMSAPVSALVSATEVVPQVIDLRTPARPRAARRTPTPPQRTDVVFRSHPLRQDAEMAGGPR